MQRRLRGRVHCAQREGNKCQRRWVIDDRRFRCFFECPIKAEVSRIGPNKFVVTVDVRSRSSIFPAAPSFSVTPALLISTLIAGWSAISFFARRRTAHRTGVRRLGGADLEWLASQMTEVELAPGEVSTREGASLDRMFCAFGGRAPFAAKQP